MSSDKHALKEYDYIICGGGTAGCVVASRLASQTSASVLLVEAGRDAGIAPDVLVPGKYLHQLSADLDGLWQLPTVPQKELGDREILFLRGKQLGGSSAVNYMGFARGPSADYDEWARLTGDDGWAWKNILPLMKNLENFRPQRPNGFEEYATPEMSCHGSVGPIKVGFGEKMSPGVEVFFKACQEAGINICHDNNSGNPVGVSLAQCNTGEGLRWYAANGYLSNESQKRLSNLTILTNVSVDKIMIEENNAVGVKIFDNQAAMTSEILCRKEVVVCQGTFGSPQLLMLSGVGPKDHLSSLGIECVLDNKSVGQNMLDHSILTIEYQVNDSALAHNQIFDNPQLLAEADEQYEKDKSGPHNVFGTSGCVAFPKIDRLCESQEFKQLDEPTKAFMLEPCRPSAEIWLGSGPSAFTGGKPHESYITHELLLQNNLSKGSISLKSADPRALPQIDPQFLKHPYDKRIAIESVREAIGIGKTAAYNAAIRRLVHGPSDDSDESILEFVRANLGQGYHSLGTCKMGRRTDEKAVVDQQFRLIGLKKLRVADLSVCPILTCNHTQINAYLIGERCAEQLISEFWTSNKSMQGDQDMLSI